MHEILNFNALDDPDLKMRVNVIANLLSKDLAGRAEDQTGGQTALLERALIYAAHAEKRVADQDQRIAYLQDLSLTDELTGLLNRRGFSEQFHRALATARRYGHEGMLLYCDLDDFKSVNDAYGHAAGDALLRHASKILLDSVRECDLVARLGGDEFAVALIQSSWPNGTKRARTLQWRMEHTDLIYCDQVIPLNVSIGCEPFGPDDEIEDLICRADMAMYCSKRRKTVPLSRVAAE